MNMPLNYGESNQCPWHEATPVLRRAIDEAIRVIQAPPGMVLASALAAAAVAVQGKYDVRRLNGLVSPCSLFFITMAESGERKTAVDRYFFGGITKFEQSLTNNKLQPEASDTLNGPGQEVRFLYSDTTPMAFMMAMSKRSSSAILNEDEAGRIFTGRLIDDLGLLNKLWDGRTISVDRVKQSFSLKSPRVSISWMVQPSVFAKYMERKGDDARGIGTLARSLVCFPTSTQGTRFIRDVPVTTDGIDAFNRRISELMSDQLEYICPNQVNPKERELLYFDPVAQAEFETIFNQIEGAIQPGGYFCQHRDYASKVAENISRLAGVLHVFEANSGNAISPETLKSATAIALWYAQEFVRLFSPPGPADIVRYYASLLDEWLLEHFRMTNQWYVNKTTLLQIGPNKIRSVGLMDIALQRLQEVGRIYLESHPGQFSRKSTLKVRLNDAYYGNIVRGISPYGFPCL